MTTLFGRTFALMPVNCGQRALALCLCNAWKRLQIINQKWLLIKSSNLCGNWQRGGDVVAGKARLRCWRQMSFVRRLNFVLPAHPHKSQKEQKSGERGLKFRTQNASILIEGANATHSHPRGPGVEDSYWTRKTIKDENEDYECKIRNSFI